MKILSYMWRLFATALCFFIFGIGGLLLSIFICPLQLVVYRDVNKRKKKARKMVYNAFRFFVYLLKITGVASFKLDDYHKLKTLNGFLIMANHPCLIDVVVMMSIIPNADCVVKAKLFKNPFIWSILKNTGYISNDCAEGLIDDCKASLQAGNNLIIFPEGTRTTPGKEIKFQRGAANIALRCKAQIATVLLKVSPSTLTKADKWYQIPNCRFEFSLKMPNREPVFESVSDMPMSKQSRKFTHVLEQYFVEELRRV